MRVKISKHFRREFKKDRTDRISVTVSYQRAFWPEEYMDFEYAKFLTRAGAIYRPSLNVTFAFQSRRVPYSDALVDTGSDFVLLPMSIAELLGAEPDLESVTEMSCACGGNFHAYESRYPIDIIVDHRGFMPKKFLTHVQFVDAPITPLLGHRGFLDRFDATFFGNKHTMRLRPKSS